MTTLEIYLSEETEMAQRIIAAAQSFIEEHAAWEVAAEMWAEQWTDVLFEPFMLWKVRYAPIWPANACGNDGSLSEVVTIEDPETIAAMGVPAFVHSVTGWGEVERMAIGAMLDAKPLAIDKPDLRRPIPYARTFTAGGRFFVNLPPDSGLMPRDPGPKRPELYFVAWLMQHVPDWEEHFPHFARDFNDVFAPSITEIADMTPDKFLQVFA